MAKIEIKVQFHTIWGGKILASISPFRDEVTFITCVMSMIGFESNISRLIFYGVGSVITIKVCCISTHMVFLIIGLHDEL